jgi:putative FmdB family regulatory protein
LPLYPYRCTQCGHRFEKIQHFKDEPEKVCPQCGGVLERPLTAPGLQFKGAGWYVNDYAPKSSSSTGSSSGDAASGDTSEKKPETKSDSKTETKSEAKTASGKESSAPSPASTSAPSEGSSTTKD